MAMRPFSHQALTTSNVKLFPPMPLRRSSTRKWKTRDVSKVQKTSNRILLSDL